MDVKTFCNTAMQVKAKGVDPVALSGMKNFLLEIGRTQAVLQSDNEPSIKLLLAELCRLVPGLSRRHSPAYSSKSMGAIGNLQVQLYGQMRTMRADLEKRLGRTIRLNHRVISWLLHYCSFLLTRFLVHEDGVTSYYRRWQKNYSGALCNFCELV